MKARRSSIAIPTRTRRPLRPAAELRPPITCRRAIPPMAPSPAMGPLRRCTPAVVCRAIHRLLRCLRADLPVRPPRIPARRTRAPRPATVRLRMAGMRRSRPRRRIPVTWAAVMASQRWLAVRVVAGERRCVASREEAGMSVSLGFSIDELECIDWLIELGMYFDLSLFGWVKIGFLFDVAGTRGRGGAASYHPYRRWNFEGSWTCFFPITYWVHGWRTGLLARYVDVNLLLWRRVSWELSALF